MPHFDYPFHGIDHSCMPPRGPIMPPGQPIMPKRIAYYASENNNKNEQRKNGKGHKWTPDGSF